MAGKRWTKEEVEKLKELLAAGKTVAVIAAVLGRSEDSVYRKIKRLGLKLRYDDDGIKNQVSSSLVMPEEIPSVETVLKKAVAALNALETPGLSKTEVIRLRALVQSAATVQVKIGEYVDYRRIEAKLIDLDEKYERLIRERRKNTKTC